MKLLSFDVGIKNLSYCLLNDENIEGWGILNISIDELCQHCHPTNGSMCDKSAKYICSDIKLCTAHKKLKKYSDKKFKCIPKNKNHMLEQGKKIVEIFNNNPSFLDVDTVVIENQPALKNPTMKSIQMMIYSYFLIKGVSSDSSNIDNIEMVNARHKLKAYKGPTIACDIKDKYKRTKFLGIQYCLSMIVESNQDDTWVNIFTTSKKKDDLADAYLQGIYFIHKL